MPSRTVAGIGLKADWDLGENNWKDEMDLNLVTLSVLIGGKVLSRVSATPGAPAEGDIHIFKADHPTNANAIAVYDEAAWKYLTPVDGLTLYSVADLTRYEYSATAAAWVRVARPFHMRPVQSGNYVAVLADADGMIPFDPGADSTFTINSGIFEVGTRLFIEQRGAGKITFTAGAGVTVRSRDAAYKTAGQYAVAQAFQSATDVWTVTGDVTA